MRDAGGSTTRGLVGAIELRDPADGVILPHENTMAGPVADRLALMSATETNVEAIYLVYDGGGAASDAVSALDDREPIAHATTTDGIAASALGHHRSGRPCDGRRGPGRPSGADRRRASPLRDLPRAAAAAAGNARRRAVGLRTDPARRLEQLRAAGTRDSPGAAFPGRSRMRSQPLAGWGIERDRGRLAEPDAALAALGRWTARTASPQCSPTGTVRSWCATTRRRVRAASGHEGETATLIDLDVTVLHRGMVEQVWDWTTRWTRSGTPTRVDEAIAAAQAGGGDGGAAAPDAGGSRRRRRRGRCSDAAQVDAVHPQAGLGPAHASLRRRRLTRAELTSTS